MPTNQFKESLMSINVRDRELASLISYQFKNEWLTFINERKFL